MQQALLDQLRKITEEERKILDGEAEVDRDLYTSGRDFTVDSRKMLKEGRLIAVRTHTRFVHFPAHRHNFIEVLYVCQGQLTNIIGGKEVVIRQGELLFLNQYTRHEILPAGEEDIAINFMILPEFFDVAYTMAGNNNVLADFLVNVLRQDDERGEYLHFKVAEVLKKILKERMDIEIDEHEVGYVALHIHSALGDEKVSVAMQTARTVRECIAMIEMATGRKIDVISLSYNRMMNHIKYMVARVSTGETLKLDMNEYIEEKYPESYRIAEDVCKSLGKSLGKELDPIEIGYLAMHIERTVEQ